MVARDVKAFQTLSKGIDGQSWGHKRPLRFIVEYGFHQLGEQVPYFSITGHIEKTWKCNGDPWVACGCLHDDITEHFPELAPLIPWHLVAQNGEPMHYIANSLFHLKQGDFDAFKHCCLYGVLPSDGRFTPDPFDLDGAAAWLRARLPMLAAYMVETMKRFGCKPIIDRGAAEW